LVSWDVEYTNELEDWWQTLTVEEQERVAAAVELLEERGPNLGRPIADRIAGSSIHKLKELRPSGTNIRILFAFGPPRAAILLLGGDKTGKWDRWYAEAVPVAERLYEEYVEELKREQEEGGSE
jgi:hypothetical protein